MLGWYVDSLVGGNLVRVFANFSSVWLQLQTWRIGATPVRNLPINANCQ